MRKRSICSGLVTACSAALLALAPGPALAVGAANEESCPNAALRVGPSASLPDCRAYELVSPAEKNGFGPTFEHLIGDGEAGVQSESIGMFAGATGSVGTILYHYISQRSGTGWQSGAVESAPSELTYAGSQGQPVLVNANKEALLLLHPTEGSVYERDIYKRNANGSFTKVGPALPAYAVPPTPTGSRYQGISGSKQFLGTTPDLSHTLFTLQPLQPGERIPPGVPTELWPGDTTALGSAARPVVSLYEYAGTGSSEPELVGVRNQRSLAEEASIKEDGHIDEAAELLSNCGISPGSDSGNGGAGVAGNHHNAISEDGETVFFTALGADNTACKSVTESPPVEELFARLQGAQTVAISEPQALAPAAAAECTGVCAENTSVANKAADWRDGNFEGASRDGSKVFFTSTQQLLNGATEDPNPEDSARELAQEPKKGCRETTAGDDGCNLYEYEFTGPGEGHLVLLSGGDTSGIGPNVQGVAALSEDGSHVYFVARGVLTKTPNEYGREASSEMENLYVRDTVTGETKFVATLAQGDSEQWSSAGEFPMNVTNDGRFLVFTSTARLTPGDTSSVAQVFRYDASTGALIRVSIGEEGYNDDGNVSGETAIARGGSLPGEEIAFDQHPAVSEDGSVVAFKSTVALTPGALENTCFAGEAGVCFERAENVYEYNEGHVHLISYSPGSAIGIFEGTVAVSPSGADIFFESRDPLVPQDTDTLGDIYDARVGGGFPMPLSPQCEGEGCQGALSVPAAVQAPSSATFSPPAGAPVAPAVHATAKKAPVRCAKGRRRSHGRCVKPKRKSQPKRRKRR